MAPEVKRGFEKLPAPPNGTRSRTGSSSISVPALLFVKENTRRVYPDLIPLGPRQADNDCLRLGTRGSPKPVKKLCDSMGKQTIRVFFDLLVCSDELQQDVQMVHSGLALKKIPIYGNVNKYYQLFGNYSW